MPLPESASSRRRLMCLVSMAHPCKLVNAGSLQEAALAPRYPFVASAGVAS